MGVDIFLIKKVSFLSVALCLVTVLLIFDIFEVAKDVPDHTASTPPTLDGIKVNPFEPSSILDGCFHVYVDVGSNIGVQVRKLYQPELYPGAEVLPVFDNSFGNIYQRRNLSNKLCPSDDCNYICAVGFEPNSHHTEYLKGMYLLRKDTKIFQC